MNGKSLKFNSVLNATRMLLTVLVPLITFPYTSRIFLTEGSGAVNFVTSTVQIFTLFASLGIYSYGIREGAKVLSERKKFSILTSELFAINVIATIATYIVFIGMIVFIPRFRNYESLLLINGISIGFTALGLDWIFGAFEEYTYITVRQIIVQLFSIVALFLFVHDKGDITKWIVILTLSTVIPNVYNFFYARRHFSFVKIDLNALKLHMRPILVLFATTVAAKVYSNIDTFLLGIMTADHNVGIYSAAVKLNTILITFFAAMTPVFVPRIVKALTEGERNSYDELLKKIFSAILSICLPAVAGLLMVSREIIYVLAGPAFADAVLTMRILAPIVLVTSCANILYYDVLVPNNKEAVVFRCTILGAILNIVISFFLIPIYKENGAAIGSIASETIALLCAAAVCYRSDRKLIINFMDVKNYIWGSAAVVSVCLLVKTLFSNEIVILVLSVVVSTIAYAGILLVTHDYVGEEMIRMIDSCIKKVSGRSAK